MAESIKSIDYTVNLDDDETGILKSVRKVASIVKNEWTDNYINSKVGHKHISLYIYRSNIFKIGIHL